MTDELKMVITDELLEDDAAYYREVLEVALNGLCEVMGKEADYYDRDQADGECYLDCFRDSIETIKKTKLSIGEFTLSKGEDGHIWIEHEDGEGGGFKTEKLEKIIEQFYKDNF